MSTPRVTGQFESLNDCETMRLVPGTHQTLGELVLSVERSVQSQHPVNMGLGVSLGPGSVGRRQRELV